MHGHTARFLLRVLVPDAGYGGYAGYGGVIARSDEQNSLPRLRGQSAMSEQEQTLT